MWGDNLTFYASCAYEVMLYSPAGEVLTSEDMENPDEYFESYTQAGDHPLPTPIAPEGKLFVGWSMSPDDTKNTIQYIEEGTTGKIILYAVYEDKYSITYYNGDTQIEGFAELYYSYAGEYYRNLPDEKGYPELLPERDGQIFVGWCTEKDLSGTVLTDLYAEAGWSGDLTLYACYADYYTVTWYSWDRTTVLAADDMKYSFEYFDKYTSVRDYDCPTPIAPEGKGFIGWSTTPNDLKNTMYDIPKGTTGDLKLYAFYGNSYSITYYDGDTKIEGFDDWYSSYTEDEWCFLPSAENNPELLSERDGQIFVGWCTNKDLSGEVLIEFYADDDWRSDITLYAYYADYYTVTWYSSDGTTVLTADDMEYSYGYFDKYTSVRDYDCPTPIAPEGKGFLGWSTSPNDIENAEINIWKGTTGDLKLYAVYGSTYSVTYYDGDTKIEDFYEGYYSYTESVGCSLPDARRYPDILPERNGQIFAGWCTEKDLNGRVLTEFNANDDWRSDITLYAYYADYYTVTWYSADGTTVLTTDDMTYSEDYIDKYTSVRDYYCPTPITPEGKGFVGWSTTPNDLKNTIYDIPKGTKDDLKLYAVYGSTYSITYYDGDTKIEGFDDWYYSYTEGAVCYLPGAEEYPQLLSERDGQIFVGWCKSSALSDKPIMTLEKGTGGNLKLYARFISIESIENLSVTPSPWVLNSDASAAGGKLTVRVTGVAPSVISVYSGDETIVIVENTEKDEYGEYYIWSEDKEKNSVLVYVAVGAVWQEISLTFRDMPDILTLPAAMQTIKAEAFMNCTNIDGVSVRGNKLTEIQSGAFKNCTGLYFIELPDSVTDIADDAFEGCANVQFYCSDHSTAAAYAEAHGIPHSPLYQE